MEQEEFITFPSNRSKNKILSNDIINVKFNQTVRSGIEIIKYKEDKIKELKDNEELTEDDQKYIEQLMRDIEVIKKESKGSVKGKWVGVRKKQLRQKLYENGFTIIKTDPETGEITFKEKYLFYKRSSSKSRKGECLFIKKSLHNKMKNWSRMNLPLVDGMKLDLPGLLSYESLVGSTIEDTLEIKPENILIVEEETSTFDEVCDVIYKKEWYEKNDNGETVKKEKLDCKEKKHTINNEIWDGQALLDSGEFDDGQSFKLLRNHFFKAAAFSTHIQKFFYDYAKDHCKDYDNWYVKDIFNNKVKVTDIKLIINKSCLKIFKFADVMDGLTKFEKESNIYELWKKAVENDSNVWGVCKHDKASKYNPDDNGNVHVTSYQMLNSLSANYNEMKELSQKTLDYIKLLQNDNDAFINYIDKNKNDANANQMFVDLYKINPNIIYTKVFRNFRSKIISNFKKYIKRGKLMLNGDYCTLVSNPYEYLLKAAGEDISNKSHTLKPYEINTKLFGEDGYGNEYIGFRSPHGSMANTLKLRNVENELIDEYFEFSPNIVVISSIKHNWMEKANGADMDGDAIVLFDSKKLLDIANKTYHDYKVVVNDVPAESKPHYLTLQHASDIDHTLSESKDQIGEVTNLGMLALSLYHHKLENNYKDTDEELEELMKKVKIMGVLAGLSIDSAKRKYEVDVDKEVRRTRKELELICKKEPVKDKDGNDFMKITKVYHPNFWEFVSKSENLHHTKYQCPMDQLIEVISKEVKGANRSIPKSLESLLVRKNNKAASRGQRGKAKSLAEELQKKIECIHQEYYRQSKNGKGEDDELNILVEEAINEYDERFSKLKINENTMYSILKMINNETEGKNDKGKENKGNNGYVRLMNQIYKSDKNKERFLNAFIKL
ncbi:hypothetical protein ACDI16_04315 [Oceanobacillus caeni]